MYIYEYEQMINAYTYHIKNAQLMLFKCMY